MIIFVVNIVGIFPDKSESKPPVPANLHGPGTLTISFELMKIQPRKGVQLKVKEMSERGEGEGARQGKVC
jgi:hypothetical protein